MKISLKAFSGCLLTRRKLARRAVMRLGHQFALPVIVIVAGMIFDGCASFEPGVRYQDLMRPRQPTVKEAQNGLEVSVEEFVTADKSEQAFDADIAPYGVLALLVRMENNGAQTYKAEQHAITVHLNGQILTSLSGKQAADQAATSEYVGKALGWTLATGPFAILLWPATIAGSASHTAAVNRRIEQHFENLEFNDALLKPNQSAAGFLYFKLPDGVKSLEQLVVAVTPADEQSGKKLSFKLSLPTVELSSPASTPLTASEDSEDSGDEE